MSDKPDIKPEYKKITGPPPKRDTTMMFIALLGIGYFGLGIEGVGGGSNESLGFQVILNRLITSNNSFDIAIGINANYNIGNIYLAQKHQYHHIIQFECVLSIIGRGIINL